MTDQPASAEPLAQLLAHAKIRPQTLTVIASHLDARAVAMLRPGTESFEEWQVVVACLRGLAGEAPTTTKPQPDGEPYAGDERPCLACNHSMDSHIRVDGEIVCVFEDCSDPTPAGVGQDGAPS